MSPIPRTPLQGSSFKLDTSGVAGFFGGEEAVSAMATVHLFAGRKWLGWYNSPGSYTVARRYGQLARSKVWRGLYPGAKADPIDLFELGGKKGPEYVGADSGTVLKETGYFGHLFMGYCKDIASTVVPVAGRKTTSTVVTIASLPPLLPPQSVAKRSCALVLLAGVLIACSLSTCILSAVYRDWLAFAMILWGIVANGISCFVIGSLKLSVDSPTPAFGAPRGDGFLTDGQTTLIILGKEESVNLVTKGLFKLKFPAWSTQDHNDIGLCSLLLTVQFLLQLLLIPQSTLFGQIMFLSSLAVAWVYNTFLSSFDRESLQSDMLFSSLNLDSKSMQKYELGTRTAMSVFVVLVLKPKEPRKLLDHLLPNDTDVWQAFKKQVSSQIADADNSFHCEKVSGMEGSAGDLMQALCDDANDAYKGYCKRKKGLQTFDVFDV